ncbi:30S ribosomal protein S12 methylthiotransferase RimO [Thiovibrio frasassiensis]|uniref:Ribosomal protein uS12 methylthiotransferase RimO n=1 Tax=Thiovibrio frasassiensis TaxID=2984131 RepID=A0A9X4MFA4_9BACT|nr:30S ribosomal protein S12 methylthiotransferase RimO [Thiovibrio frasassiensis]MDG4475248.1 30S ribosomal protein S12 methylthiotransferase RimO [Thiovibrio frasassiensis]
MMRTFFTVSLGCPKNLVDTELMLGLLVEAGYVPCEEAEEADLLLVNTCGFIQSAVEEGIEEILTLAGVKERFPEKKLVVVGCMVQRYGADLASELPEVDLFIGTEGTQDIVRRLQELGQGGKARVHLAPPTFLLDSTWPRRLSSPAHRAYMKVTEGCSNRCAYCLIPSLRGDLRSRNLADLVQEVGMLGENGVRELTFVAQDLTAYGHDLGPGAPHLVELLSALLEASAIPWFRLLYLYPTRVNAKLLEFMAANPRIVPYLDIPLQHVSDSVLKGMNRPYGRKQIEALLARIRSILPQAAIRTTFMVGFPGEKEDDVRQLAEFMQTEKLAHVGIFGYSNEEGCAAYKLPGQCTEEEKSERRQRLMELQGEISLARNQAMVGRVEKVLVEGWSRETDLLLEGRTRFQAPEIDGCVYITEGICGPGDIVDVRITEAHPYDLVGEIVKPGQGENAD